jgi:hypothetical protein
MVSVIEEKESDMPRKICGFIVLSVIALYCVSCDLPPGPNYPGTLPGGKPDKTGTLTLYLAGTANQQKAALSRSVLSGTFIDGLTYRFTFTRLAGGSDNGAFFLDTAAGTTTVPLEAGSWRVDAAAYHGADLVGEGSTTVTIVADEELTETITMTVDPDYEATLTTVYIHNEAELRRIGAAVGGLAIDNPSRTFYLENDIVLTRPWAPIGNITSRFKAKFDGKGHTITIISFDPDSLTGDRDYVGLFGLIDGAEIKDLNIRLV